MFSKLDQQRDQLVQIEEACSFELALEKHIDKQANCWMLKNKQMEQQHEEMKSTHKQFLKDCINEFSGQLQRARHVLNLVAAPTSTLQEKSIEIKEKIKQVETEIESIAAKSPDLVNTLQEADRFQQLLSKLDGKTSALKDHIQVPVDNGIVASVDCPAQTYCS